MLQVRHLLRASARREMDRAEMRSGCLDSAELPSKSVSSELANHELLFAYTFPAYDSVFNPFLVIIQQVAM